MGGKLAFTSIFMIHFVITGSPVCATFSSVWEAVLRSCRDDNLVFDETALVAEASWWSHPFSRKAYGWGCNAQG